MYISMQGNLGIAAFRRRVHRIINAPRLADGAMLLAILLLADAAFILGHTLHKLTPLLADAAYALDMEWGYPEIFQYVKFGALVALLGVLWSRTREPLFGAWMLLLTYALCDDSLQVHERVGAQLAAEWHFGHAFGLRAIDFGELIVTGTAGTALVSLIVFMGARSGRLARSDSRTLAILIAALGFFGVVMDMVHVVADGYIQYVGGMLGIIEDGGEMVVVSLMCWYVSTLVPRRGLARRRREGGLRPVFTGAPMLPNVPRPL